MKPGEVIPYKVWRWPWVSRSYANYLERELAFYRKAWEDAQARAERAVDRLTEATCGIPISNDGVAAQDKRSGEVAELEHQLSEIFGETLPNYLTGLEGNEN